MPASPPSPAWTMSEMVENALCEKFEANVFAKSRCQNCFRTIGAHQPGYQAAEKQALKTLDCGDGTIKPSPCKTRDPLCILVPQCEVYECVDSEERTEEEVPQSWQESLEYTQLSSRVEEEEEEEEETEESSVCHDTNSVVDFEADVSATLSRVRWRSLSLSLSLSLSVHSKPMSQDHGDSRKKHPPENGYFSLERRKSEPSRASSPPQAGRGVLPSHGDAVRASGWPASSISSADSDRSWRTSGGGSSEGQHGLVRQDYTVLADLPKPKRLNHRQAFEKERSSSRTRSPGRAEVERIFGHERRKSETLGAFQALEEGLLERLDSKTLKLAKEGRLVRRKSSPTLRRDRPERESRSRGAPLHSAVPPPKQGERERRKQQDAVYHVRVEKERAPLQLGSQGKQTESGRKSQLEASHHKSSGKTTDTKWRSCLDAVQGAGPGKSLDKSRAGHSHRRPLQEAGKPQERYKDSDRKARGKPLLPVDTREHPRKDPRDGGDAVRALSPGRKMAADGKGGQALSPPRRTEDSWKSQGEARRSLSPGRPTGISLPGRGEFESTFGPGRGLSGSPRESGRSRSPGRHVEIGVRSHGEVGAVFSLGYQRESRRSPSPGRCRESSPREARRSPSPGRPVASSCSCPKQERSCAPPEQHPGSSWSRQWEAPARTPRAGMGSDRPSKEEQPNPFAPRSDWQGCDKSLHPASPPGEPSSPPNPFWGPEMRQQSPEEPLCQVHPMQPSEKEWGSPGEYLQSAKPGQLPSEGTWRDRGSSAGWIEEEWKTPGKCPDPRRGEKQVENDLSHDEKLLHQHQPDGGPHLTSACSSSSQNAYLSTSKKHQVQYDPQEYYLAGCLSLVANS
ncbi:hypothetical protein lerEdw1_019619 [Lerista edwardsae]|nr:hypothetical protein lerEdw1_019619 [Lerista edwardsae]